MDLQRYAHCYWGLEEGCRDQQQQVQSVILTIPYEPSGVVEEQQKSCFSVSYTTNNKVSPRWPVEQNYVFYLSTRILSFSDDGVWLWLLGRVWNGRHLFAVLHKGLTMGREGTSQRFKSAIGWHERTKRRKERRTGGGWRQRVHGNGSFSPPPPSSSGISPMLWR